MQRLAADRRRVLDCRRRAQTPQSREFNAHVENSAWFPPGYFTQPPECAKTS